MMDGEDMVEYEHDLPAEPVDERSERRSRCSIVGRAPRR
jgi:hypothetical protein